MRRIAFSSRGGKEEEEEEEEKKNGIFYFLTFSGANRMPAKRAHCAYIEASFPQLKMMTRC